MWAQKQTSHHAFTVVELLIVIVVIGILATLTIIAYSGVQNQARTAAIQSTLEQSYKKLEQFKFKNGEIYPDSQANAIAAGAPTLSGATMTYYPNTQSNSYCIEYRNITNGSVVGSVSSTRSVPTTAACIENSLVNRWRLDNNANDSIATNNGTATGVLTGAIGQSGQSNTAYSFNGTSYLTVNRMISEDFTICGWLKTTSVGAGLNHWQGMPIYDAEIGGQQNDFSLGINSAGNLMFGTGQLSTGDYTIASASVVNNDAWTLGCATRNMASGRMNVYVNGVLGGSGIGSRAALTIRSTARIGYGYDGATYWNGSLDDVRVYDRMLSAEELLVLQTAGAGY